MSYDILSFKIIASVVSIYSQFSLVSGWLRAKKKLKTTRKIISCGWSAFNTCFVARLLTYWRLHQFIQMYKVVKRKNSKHRFINTLDYISLFNWNKYVCLYIYSIVYLIYFAWIIIFYISVTAHFLLPILFI